jgi:hypothetical protein
MVRDETEVEVVDRTDKVDSRGQHQRIKEGIITVVECEVNDYAKFLVKIITALFLFMYCFFVNELICMLSIIYVQNYGFENFT